MIVVIVNIVTAVLPIILEDEGLPYHDSILTGKLRVEELMTTRNSHRFMDNCRMDKRTFNLLLNFLIEHGELRQTDLISYA
jgi:hypothetical protein